MLTIAPAITNRLISNKNVSFDFIEPFNFTSEILARPARLRGELQTQNSSKNSLNPIECILIENARTFYEKNKWILGGAVPPPPRDAPPKSPEFKNFRSISAAAMLRAGGDQHAILNFHFLSF